MSGKVKTTLLVILLVVIAGVALYQNHESKEAKAKALAIQEAQEKADVKPVQKYVAPPSPATQVVGATSYSDAELINIANESYAQFIKSSNTYNFTQVVNKSVNGNELTATLAATCNGQAQNITIDFKQVDNVVSIVGTATA